MSARSRPKKTAQPPFVLPDESSKDLSKVADLLQGRRNIVVLCGAGISVSSGIPDFRSKNTGLYETLNVEELGLSCPEELFDLSFFQEDPGPFYHFARRLYFPSGSRNKPVHPSDAHRLLALLDQQGVLLRVYSQNIDGLEVQAGVNSKKVCYAHGSLQWANCQKCKRKVDWSVLEDDVWHGRVAKCKAVSNSSSKKRAETKYESIHSTIESVKRTSSRKRGREENEVKTRTRGDTEKLNHCGGVLKPGVTFFGEALDDRVRRCLEADRNKVDALIVMGTSLSVAPISKAIRYFPPSIPRILINRTIVHPSQSALESEDDSDDEDERDFREGYVFDAYLLGFCDDVTRSLGRALVPARMDGNTITKPGLQRQTSPGEWKGDADSNWDWSTVKVPRNRVFLFPGAACARDDDASDITYREVAQCDGCAKNIEGQIRKCLSCFDFDLCSNCYPLLSKQHFNGKHRFSLEEAQGVE